MVTKILHTILLALVLSSSTGFVLGKHHCQRMEQSKEEKVGTCADMGGCKKGCCTSEDQYFHLDQDQQIPQVDINLPSCPFAPHISPNWAAQLPIYDLQALHFRTYRPPIVLWDISIRFQVFRC